MPRGLAPALTALVGMVVALLLAECVTRLLEPAHGVQGEVVPLDDPELGWLPRPGRSRTTTGEYSVVYDVNALGLNDGPRDPISASPPTLLALGDSHTFAVGVSWNQAWPHVLETLLHEQGRAGAVYNAGVAAYSLGQSLLRMRRLLGLLKPRLVLLGVSMATDLYDLIPPDRGGFVFLSHRGRAYFDLDASGALIERRELIGRTDLTPGAGGAAASLRLRSWLERFALYRRLKSSAVAMRVGGVWQPGGASLWPGPDTAMRRRLDGEDAYRWALAEALLRQTAAEAQTGGARLIVVNIPYLPQVYDEVWQASFGRRPGEYDRWIAGERLGSLCRNTGSLYADTTHRFVEESRRSGRWLHYRQDKHPTPEGHRLIALEVLATLQREGLLEPWPSQARPLS